MSVLTAVLGMSLQKRHWPRTVREVLARQVLFTGVEAVTLTAGIAVLAGVSVVMQAQLWLTRLGQSGMLGPLLVGLVLREVGPLLVIFIIIGRSVTAMAAELASMRAHGEVHCLDAQGIDPMVYLVLPRVLGAGVAAVGLAVVFVAVCLLSGGMAVGLSGSLSGGPLQLIQVVLAATDVSDVAVFLWKTLAAGLLVGMIACVEGLSSGGRATEVPQATTRAVVRAISLVMILYALTAVLTYV